MKKNEEDMKKSTSTELTSVVMITNGGTYHGNRRIFSSSPFILETDLGFINVSQSTRSERSGLVHVAINPNFFNLSFRPGWLLDLGEIDFDYGWFSCFPRISYLFFGDDLLSLEKPLVIKRES